MRIRIVSDKPISKRHKNIVKLLELDEDFEKAVWEARGRLGIKPEELEIPLPSKGDVQKVYQTALTQRPLDKPTHQDFIDCEVYFKKPLAQKLEDAKTQEGRNKYKTMKRIRKEFSEILNEEATKLVSKYKSLPRTWIQFFKLFILTNKLYIEEQIGPIKLHFDPYVFQKPDKVFLEPKYNIKPPSVNIAITAMVSKNTVISWIIKHWDEIELLLNEAELPGNWEPDIESIDTDKKLLKKNRKKKLGEISDDITSKDENAKKSYYDETYLAKKAYRLRKYILKLKTGQ